MRSASQALNPERPIFFQLSLALVTSSFSRPSYWMNYCRTWPEQDLAHVPYSREPHGRCLMVVQEAPHSGFAEPARLRDG